MTKPKRILLACCAVIPVLAFSGYALATRVNPNSQRVVGEQIDALNGVTIYFNGGVNTSNGRNLTADGYNLGIRYQCVEFVKRYYFERYGHRMPDAYGHAKHFFDPLLADGAWNPKRAMRQFTNGSGTRPEADDLVVFGPWVFNPYGHVAVVSVADATSLEVAQQNPGPFEGSRETLPVAQRDGKWFIEHPRALGWLRLEPKEASAGEAPQQPMTENPDR